MINLTNTENTQSLNNSEKNKTREEILKSHFEVQILFENENENNNNTQTKNNISTKGLIIGDSSVGKSSILYWMTHNKFVGENENNHFFDIKKISFIIEETNILLSIIEIPGNDNFDDILKKNIDNCKVIIFVYSIDKKNSFEKVKSMINKLNIDPGIICCLLGNKLDNDGNREILKEEGEEYSKEIEFDFFEEISAKNGNNIIEIFKKIGEKIYKHEKVSKIENSHASSEVDYVKSLEDINKEIVVKKKGCCCCYCF